MLSSKAYEVGAKEGLLSEDQRNMLRGLPTGKAISFAWYPDQDTDQKLAPYVARIDRASKLIKAHSDGYVTLSDGNRKAFALTKDQFVLYKADADQAGREIKAIVSKAMNTEGQKLRAEIAKLTRADERIVNLILSVNTVDRRFEITCTKIANVADVADDTLDEMDQDVLSALGLTDQADA